VIAQLSAHSSATLRARDRQIIRSGHGDVRANMYFNVYELGKPLPSDVFECRRARRARTSWRISSDGNRTWLIPRVRDGFDEIALSNTKEIKRVLHATVFTRLRDDISTGRVLNKSNLFKLRNTLTQTICFPIDHFYVRQQNIPVGHFVL